MPNTGWVGAEAEDDADWVWHTPDGRTLRDADVSVTEDQYKAMWDGYTCAWCGEVWPEQWPKQCSLPGCWSPKPMSEILQRQYLDERYGGQKWFGPSQQTIDRMNAPEACIGASTGSVSVWIPRSWKPE